MPKSSTSAFVRAGLAVGVLSVTVHAGDFATAALGPYPEEADAGVMGVVTVTASMDSLTITGSLSGLPVATVAGFHIHSGYSCDTTDEVGGHWYNDASSIDDPWTTTYSSDASGMAELDITLTKAELGYDVLDSLTHTVVLHDSDGKIACGVLAAPSVATAVLGPYPEEADAGVMGVVTVTVIAGVDSLTITGSLSGLPVDTVAGFHIHSGFSCDTTDEVGGHWYNELNEQIDPWNTTYSSDNAGVAELDIVLTSTELGYSVLDSLTHTVVVHDSNAKIACGVLGASTIAPTMAPTMAPTANVPAVDPAAGEFAVAELGPYPGQADVGVMGTIVVETSMDMLTITGTLSGLPVNTEAGFHIHSGFSCVADDEVGGHWYDDSNSLEDPWTTTTYSSDASGMAELDITMTATELGYDVLDSLTHTVVVHDPDGKIACGVLGESSTATAAPTSTDASESTGSDSPKGTGATNSTTGADGDGTSTDSGVVEQNASYTTTVSAPILAFVGVSIFLLA